MIETEIAILVLFIGMMMGVVIGFALGLCAVVTEPKREGE